MSLIAYKNSAALGLLLLGLGILGIQSILERCERSGDSAAGREADPGKILSLPYLQGYYSAPEKSGVLAYNQESASPGVNLMVTNGDPPVFLLDMDGTVLHAWEFPDFSFVRRACLNSNGDLLAIAENKCLVKIDKDSKLIWSMSGNIHHDFDVAANGDIYLLTESMRTLDIETKHIARNLRGKFMDNRIVVFSPENFSARDFSIFDCIINSDYSSMLGDISLSDYDGDILHTNTLEVIPAGYSEYSPHFKEGYILVSFRNLHYIAVIDPKRCKVVWACSGLWTHQHQPTVLSNGNILLFDNLGEKGMSKVIEFNPSTQEIVWSYRGDKENGFFTENLGSQQRLANGNTLIVESCKGRVFEVTPDNEICWEFINPQQTESGLTAVVNDALRLSRDDLTFIEETAAGDSCRPGDSFASIGRNQLE